MSLSLNKAKLDNLASDIWKYAGRLCGKFRAYEYLSAILSGRESERDDSLRNRNELGRMGLSRERGSMSQVVIAEGADS
jgi:hypothetical protein